jgi:hypothetical protein
MAPRKAEKLLVAVALHALADYRALEHVERGEQGGRAVAQVIMGHGAGLARLERQPGLGAIERLDLMGWMAPSRHRRAKLVAVEVTQQEPSTMEITTIGLDLAKHVFQVHGVDEAGHAVVERHLRRAQVITYYFASLPPCLIGMEACARTLLGARAKLVGTRGCA